jgi:glutathione peroxidase
MLDRRGIVTGTLALLASTATRHRVFAQDDTNKGGISRMTAYGFSFAALKDGDVKLADYSGRPMLIVNTASLCGYTPQYAGLQQMWTEFRDRGLMIIGVPSNDFAQEPGGAAEIADMAQVHYGVTFPITAKTTIRGANAHPFYKWAAEARPRDVPRWNFHKYLVGRDGYLADAFPESIEPTDTRIKTAVARALTSV